MIKIEGLESNCYYINNDIMVKLTSDHNEGYFKVLFNNNTTGKSTGYLTIHQDSKKEGIINISPILKGLHSIPRNNDNYGITQTTHAGRDVVSMNVTHSKEPSGSLIQRISKSYVRGGVRTQRTNVVSVLDRYLQPNAIIPVWEGFPVSVSFLPTTGQIQHTQPPEYMIERLRTEGCGYCYIRFLNQLGGYSYWLFSTSKLVENNKPLGSFLKYGYSNTPPSNVVASKFPETGLVDLGQEYEGKINVSSKVPLRFLDLIRDLEISPEVHYLTPTLQWQRVFVQGGSIEKDINKKASLVKLTIDLQNRFNPSLLWSN